MEKIDGNPAEQPNQVTVEVKKELEKLAEEKKNPKLVESFNNLIARKAGQVF